MFPWQIDFSERPLASPQGETLWELLICDPEARILLQAQCPQNQVRLDWVIKQLKDCIERNGKPERLQFFRPQFQSLLEVVGQELGILLEPTRRTMALKKLLEAQAKTYPQIPNYVGAAYEPTRIVPLPPVPLPENIWGEGWQFTGLGAEVLETTLLAHPIPILSLSLDILPSRLGLAPTSIIPGVVIYGGRRTMALARWLQEQNPVELRFIAGEPDGLVMAAGLRERWVLFTFNDTDVRIAAQHFTERQRQSCGLHFLLVQPDDSGVTYTGLWLLKLPE